MLTTLFTVVVTFSPALESTLSPPPVVEAPLVTSGRSASLLAQETVALERRVRRSRLLPTWAPLAVGLGGGALSGGLAYLTLSSVGGSMLEVLGKLVGGVFLLAAVVTFVGAGVITAIVFAVKNVELGERRAAAQRDLERSRADLARARESERAQALLAPWRAGLESAPSSLALAAF